MIDPSCKSARPRNANCSTLLRTGGFMPSAQILNLDPAPSSNSDPTPDRGVGKIEESIDHARSDIRRTQLRLDQQQDQQEAHEKRTRILTISLALLVLLFGAAFWYAYPTLKDHPKTLGEMLSMQNFAAAVAPRVNSLEAKFDKSFPQVADRMDQMEAS